MFKAWKRVGYLASWCNALLDDLRGLRPLESSTVKPECIPGVGTLFHAIMPATPSTPVEWDVSVAGETATVTTGQVAWGSQLLDPGAATFTVDLSGMGASDARWVYVQVNFASRDVTVGLTADDDKAVSQPNDGLLRVNLAKVQRQTDTGTIVVILKRHVDLDIHGAMPL